MTFIVRNDEEWAMMHNNPNFRASATNDQVVAASYHASELGYFRRHAHYSEWTIQCNALECLNIARLLMGGLLHLRNGVLRVY